MDVTDGGSAVTDGSGHGTLANSIHLRLRDDVLRGVFRPGEKLPIEALCARYGIGATPLREALNRLSAEELVIRSDQRGFRVAPISLGDLEELTRTLCWISEIGLREAIRNGDTAWEEQVVVAAHRLSRVEREGAEGYSSFNPEWETLHRTYHLTLIGACGSRWLVDFYAMLMDRHTRYRYLAFADASVTRDAEAEHRAITGFVLARDADRAIAAAEAHIRLTAQTVVNSFGMKGADATSAKA
ncbi:MAG TPA: GntR family transcriptional regulator [Acetobacteraceae bacterium]|jgi:GntR family transcriptional regulator, carbon starvation induced regulator|nr:GntR family transcriptional regulator [Acetobacteraceae bacterium]